MLDRANSTKLTAASRRSAIYPYYAGFTEQFVDSIVSKLEIGPTEVVLDPWNGSGTTTSVCSRRGIPSIGIDLNPAMKPVAAVRSMTMSDVQAICDLAVSTVESLSSSNDEVSPFTQCKTILDLAKAKAPRELHDGFRFGLMLACRAMARDVRSKNPTWYSIRALRSLRINTSAIHAQVLKSFQTLSDRERPTSEAQLPGGLKPRLMIEDWDKFRWRRKVSHVITSPPYLTRIDYVMKTLPELMFLNEEEPINFDALRRRMLGSVLTKSAVSGKLHSTPEIDDITERITSHTSKASSTYYRLFFKHYFNRLIRSFHRFKKNAYGPSTITVVSQGSYYKEIFVDLPVIIDGILQEIGFSREEVYSFPSTNNMVLLNRRAAASELPSPPEIVGIYRRF